MMNNTMENPESPFNKFKPDYSGMDLSTFAYGHLENLYGQEEEYLADCITAPGSHGPQPVVLFVHGGGFALPCNRRQAYISVFARLLTSQGYTVISPDYPVFNTVEEARRQQPLAWKTSACALNRLCTYLEQHHARLGIDPDRMVIMGGSAGGMAAFYSVAQAPRRFRCLINLWGVPEILPDLRQFPPVLSVHGTEDQLVPYAREQALIRELERLHIPCKLISLPGCGHTPIPQISHYGPEILAWLKQYGGYS